MPLRPTRSILILLAVLALFTTISILENKIKAYTRGNFSIITAPTHSAVQPRPQIVDFWAEFADILNAAHPTTPPLTVTHELSGEELESKDESDGERKPFHRNIGVPHDFVKSLAQKHLALITNPDFDLANEKASDTFKGTGIVTIANKDTFAPAIISIRMLRKTNSTLPVQVFLQSQSDYEPDVCEGILPTLNADCFVLEDHILKSNPFQETSYEFKALAILLSSFEKVLFLDNDCFPVRDPDELFTSNPFNSTGLISWPDYWIATEDPVFYMVAGLAEFPTGVPARSSELGQIMVDKTKHLSTLLLATYYNIFGPEVYYPLLSQGAIGDGDKETFLAAAVVLGKPFYRTRENVGTIGYIDPQFEFHGGAMLQYSPADEWTYEHANYTEKQKAQKKPRPFFLHANMPVMNVAHLLDDKSIFLPGTQKRIRLWGDATSMDVMFGYDVEKVVWHEMRDVACNLGGALEDFKNRKGLCGRANEHYKELFDPKSISVPDKTLSAT